MSGKIFIHWIKNRFIERETAPGVVSCATTTKRVDHRLACRRTSSLPKMGLDMGAAAGDGDQELHRLLENEHVVVDRVHKRGQGFPSLSSSCIDEIYWLTGETGGTLQAKRHDPGPKAPAKGIRVALLRNGATQTKLIDNDTKKTAVGTRLLYTDEKIVIWEFYLPPGTRCHYHQHHLPYFYTNLTESLTQELDAQGDVKDPSVRRLQKIRHTTFLTQKELGQHAVLNVGESPLLQFIVELKNAM